MDDELVCDVSHEPLKCTKKKRGSEMAVRVKGEGDGSWLETGFQATDIIRRWVTQVHANIKDSRSFVERSLDPLSGVMVTG